MWIEPGQIWKSIVDMDISSHIAAIVYLLLAVADRGPAAGQCQGESWIELPLRDWTAAAAAAAAVSPTMELHPPSFETPASYTVTETRYNANILYFLPSLGDSFIAWWNWTKLMIKVE